MQIETLTIKNYRVFKDVTVKNLPRLTALVGTNGSGKSTFFDVFSFIKDALTHNVSKAVNKRGGFKELVSRNSSGPISISLQFRETGGRLATYVLEVDAEDGKAFISREILKYRRGSKGQPWHFVDFSRGKGSAITNEETYNAGFDRQEGSFKGEIEEERKDYVLDAPDILAIKGLGQFKEFKVVSDFRGLIENWHISDFHISEARPSVEDGLSEHLSTQGENVAQVAQYLYENDRKVFKRILATMKRRVPGINNVEATSTADGRLVLRFQDGSFKDPFIAKYVSDGTIKMFAYLVLLNDPKPFPLLAVEEPENQLYPELLSELAEEFRAYAKKGGQVFLSTHSPDLLNGLRLDEIFWLVKKNGYTTIHRASDNQLLVNLVKEGDLPGALWKQGLFDGVGLK
ncbi:MAG: AAA family ATPase [Pseudomonadota bacterium]